MSSSDQIFWIGSPGDISKQTETERVLWGQVCKLQSENDEQSARESLTRSVARKTIQSRKALRWMVLQKHMYDRGIKRNVGSSQQSLSETLASQQPAVSIGSSEYEQSQGSTQKHPPPSVYNLLSSPLLQVDVVDDELDCKESYGQFALGGKNGGVDSVALKRQDNDGYLLSPTTKADVIAAIKSVRRIFLQSGKRESFHAKVDVSMMLDTFSKACLAQNTVARGVAETHSQHKAALRAAQQQLALQQQQPQQQQLIGGSSNSSTTTISNMSDQRLSLTQKHSSRLLLQYHKTTPANTTMPSLPESKTEESKKSKSKKSSVRPLSGITLAMPTESVYSQKNLNKARPQTASVHRSKDKLIPPPPPASSKAAITRPASSFINRSSMQQVAPVSSTVMVESTASKSAPSPPPQTSSLLFEYHPTASTSTTPRGPLINPRIPLEQHEGGVLVPYSSTLRSTSMRSATQRILTRGINQMQGSTHATSTSAQLTHRDRSALFLSAELGMTGSVHEHDIQNHGALAYAVTANPSLLLSTLEQDIPVYSERGNKARGTRKKYEVKGGLEYMKTRLREMNGYHGGEMKIYDQESTNTVVVSKPPVITSHNIKKCTTAAHSFQQRITNSPYGRPIFSTPPAVSPTYIPTKHGFKSRPNTANSARKVRKPREATLSSKDYMHTSSEVRLLQNGGVSSSTRNEVSYRPPKASVEANVVHVKENENRRLAGTFRSTVEQAQLDSIKRAWRGDLARDQDPAELESDYNRSYRTQPKHKPHNTESVSTTKYWKEPRWKDSTVTGWRDYSVEKYRERIDNVLQVVDSHSNASSATTNSNNSNKRGKIESKRAEWKETEQSIRDSHSDQDLEWLLQKDLQRQKLESSRQLDTFDMNASNHVDIADVFAHSESTKEYSQQFSLNDGEDYSNEYSQDFNDTAKYNNTAEYSQVFNDTAKYNNTAEYSQVFNDTQTANQNIPTNTTAEYSQIFNATNMQEELPAKTSTVEPTKPAVIADPPIVFNTSESSIKPDQDEYWDDYDAALARFDESEQLKSAQNSVNEASVANEDPSYADSYSYEF